MKSYNDIDKEPLQGMYEYIMDKFIDNIETLLYVYIEGYFYIGIYTINNTKYQFNYRHNTLNIKATFDNDIVVSFSYETDKDRNQLFFGFDLDNVKEEYVTKPITKNGISYTWPDMYYLFTKDIYTVLKERNLA